MTAGIERINVYTPRYVTDAVALGVARGRTEAEVRDRLLLQQRSVMPPFEDAVTLAVNAAKPLLASVDRSDIELVLVGTESAVDFGKPVATWVHRFGDLAPHCRCLEVKHACYGGTGALRMALDWLAAAAPAGKKALVVTCDYTRSGMLMEYGFDFVGGACAVAMIVSREPAFLRIEPARTGYWTQEIADTFRPTSLLEIGDNQKSLYAYLDALDGAYAHFEQRCGPIDFDRCFAGHVYHAPFPAMALQAHRTVLGRVGVTRKSDALEHFHRKVEPGLVFNRRIGGSYGGSTFLGLLGQLHGRPDLDAGDRLSVFAYGSGCQSEFYEVTLGDDARGEAGRAGVERHLDERLAISIEDYEYLERTREAMVDQRHAVADRSRPDGAYASQYAGQGRLVLAGVDDFRRVYEWS
jgi:hydroxymethylglutaryl-CoA synthase